jgi:ribosome-associated protein
LSSKELADKIADLIFSKKGYDVKILDLRSLTTIADYFIICSADSDIQVKSISDEIDKNLREEGIKNWHKEGLKGLTWVLMDYVDVVVHIFKKDARQFYNLEKLWGDAPLIEVVDPLLKATQTAIGKKPARKRTKSSE